MIDRDALLAWTFPDIEQIYSEDDTIRYALAVGMGADPVDERELRFVSETGGPPLVLPTMAVILGYPGSWMADPATGIDFAQIVHGEEEIVIHRPLAPMGCIVARHRVVDVIDKGENRGAIITYDKELFDKNGGDLLATVRHTTFARGDGGFSGKVSQSLKMDPQVAEGTAERSAIRRRTLPTIPQQALLYRLCADRNPLHASPKAARSAGFDRPILHGLCTFGIASRAILADWCDYDPNRLGSLSARFSAPLLPGESLQFTSWASGRNIEFEAIEQVSGRRVLTLGRAQVEGHF